MTRHKHPTGGASSRTETRSAARGWVPWAARLAILGITLAAIAAVVIWRYGRFREGLRFFEEAHSPEFLSQDFAPLTGEQVLQLGTAHNPENVPASSYRHFAAASEPGTTRIGVFGCSFTRGAETVDGGQGAAERGTSNCGPDSSRFAQAAAIPAPTNTMITEI